MIPYLKNIIKALDSVQRSKNKGDTESLQNANQEYRDAMKALDNYLSSSHERSE